jgi:uncharacterized protein (TIGR00299 family) protein
MRTIYFDCFSGASGDMILGALIDAGASEQAVTGAIRGLGIDAWGVSVEPVSKGSLRAAHVRAATDPTLSPRSYRDIVTLLTSADLADAVRQRSHDAFRILGEAEAKIHGGAIDDVHFHEVGSDDAIIDIVGACAALEDLDVERVIVSPVATGRGYTDSMHGTIPLPAPAVVEILAGAELYERGDRELITPTGAALLASWSDSFGALPRMKIDAVGYGAGSADLGWPNVLRVIIGETQPAERSSMDTELLETNVDDMNPELVPYVIERVLDAGALDAWATPVTMKKGRLGVVLSVLVERGATQPVLDVLFRETTTFGVRISAVDREILDRKEELITVAGHPIRIKVGYRGGDVVSASPEYEDAAAAARSTGMPLKDVYRAALDAFGDL